MSKYCFYNGKYAEWSDIKIPLTDRAIFFGDGVYEACIGRNNNVYLLDRHLDRFFKNLEALNIPSKYSRERVTDILFNLTKTCSTDFFLYFQTTRDCEERRHCSKEEKSNFLAYVTEYALPNPTKRLSLITYPDLRYGYCNIKTLNLLPNTLAATVAEKNGGDEAIFLRDGIVTECAHSNILYLKDNTVYTHALDNRILPGISRGRLIEIARDIGLDICEKDFNLDSLLSADAVIVTSTSKLALLTQKIDGTTLAQPCPRAIELVSLMYLDYERQTKI